ncbi:MAG: NTP transferase domain-containing protein [Actinomycetota bacterium]|nr:NTP transferase domain-containing protein [Actinomycetota bacterium]
MGITRASVTNAMSRGQIPKPCVGILLAGGSSKRFGKDKLSQRIGNCLVVELAAKSLSAVCNSSFEAGAGLTKLAQIPDTVQLGPLAAIAKTVEHLRSSGVLEATQSAIVLAGDLPCISPSTISLLANWPGTASVVPVVDEREQYLTARWSAEALQRSIDLRHKGLLRVRDALDLPQTQWLSIDEWENQASFEFIDMDTPEDLARAIKAGAFSVEGIRHR